MTVKAYGEHSLDGDLTTPFPGTLSTIPTLSASSIDTAVVFTSPSSGTGNISIAEKIKKKEKMNLEKEKEINVNYE